MIYMDFPCGLACKESTCNAGDLAWIPGWGGSPRVGNGNPLQYSFLENPTDRGVWWVTVRSVIRGRYDLLTKPQNHHMIYNIIIYNAHCITGYKLLL